MRFPAWQHLGLLLPSGMHFEPRIAAQLGRFLSPGAVALDIDANIGLHTLLAAHLVGHGGKVHAFEPDPQSTSYLLRNIRRNDLSQVVPRTLALSDHTGVAEIHLDLKTSRKTSLLADHSAPFDDDQARQRLMVPTARLDDLGINHVDVMKVDVEGTELAMLNGARSLVERCQPVIIIEVQRENLATACAYLHEFGNAISDAESAGDPGGPNYSGNVLAVPRCAAPTSKDRSSA